MTPGGARRLRGQVQAPLRTPAVLLTQQVSTHLYDKVCAAALTQSRRLAGTRTAAAVSLPEGQGGSYCRACRQVLEMLVLPAA